MKKFQLILLLITCSIAALLWHFSFDELLKMYSSYIKIDKTGHFFGFFALCWVVHLGLKISVARTAVIISLYAALSEIGQYYLRYRDGEISDVIADVVGVIFFVLAKQCWLLIKKPSAGSTADSIQTTKEKNSDT